MTRRRLAPTKRQHDDCRHRTDPPPENGDRIERCVVGPVNVLDDEHGGRRRQLEFIDQERLDVVRRGAARQRFGQRIGDVADQIADRPEWPGDRKVVTRPQQHPGFRPEVMQELADQPRLADPRFTRDHHDTTVALRRRIPRARQRGQRPVTLEQLHALETTSWRRRHGRALHHAVHHPAMQIRGSAQALELIVKSTWRTLEARPSAWRSAVSTSPSWSLSGTVSGASSRMPLWLRSSTTATRSVAAPVPKFGAPTIQVSHNSTSSPSRLVTPVSSKRPARFWPCLAPTMVPSSSTTRFGMLSSWPIVAGLGNGGRFWWAPGPVSCGDVKPAPRRSLCL